MIDPNHYETAMSEMRSDVRAYVKELATNSVVSTSHVTLRRLYADWGMEKVDEYLEEIFDEDRRITREAEKKAVDDWYANQASAYERFQNSTGDDHD